MDVASIAMIALPTKDQLRKHRRRIGYKRRWKRVPGHVAAIVAASVAAGKPIAEVATENRLGISTCYKILKETKP